MAAKRKPGAHLQDAERHTVKRTLRLTPAESAALDSVAEARGVNVSRAVGALALAANQLHSWAKVRADVSASLTRTAARTKAIDAYFANTAPPPVWPNARKR